MRFLPPNPTLIICRLAPWGAVLVILWTGLWRAQSYVTAQDPSTIYLPLARSIADSNFSLESIRAAANWMAPGWPLLLAMVIKMGGPFAPSWIQLPFALLALIALWRIIARHADSAPAAWLAVGFTLLAWLAGPDPTFAFLLYPFREMPAFACALWAVERAGDGRRNSSALLAGFLLLGTAGLRETFVPCAAAGAVTALWVASGIQRARWYRLALLLAPAAVTLFLLAIFSFEAANRQVYSIWLNLTAGILPAPLPEAASGLFTMMARQVTWPGAILPLLALTRKSTRAAGVLLLAMTAALLVVHLLLPSHARYGLTCSLLLPAGAALGLAPLLRFVTGRSASMMAGAGLCLLFAYAVSQDPWGVPVSRAEVGDTLRRVAASLPPGRPFYVERHGRRLAALLHGYSSTWPQGDPDQPVGGGLYFRILSSREREDAAERPRLGPTVLMQLRAGGMAVAPLGDRNGRIVPMSLAGTSFQLFRVRPASKDSEH